MAALSATGGLLKLVRGQPIDRSYPTKTKLVVWPEVTTRQDSLAADSSNFKANEKGRVTLLNDGIESEHESKFVTCHLLPLNFVPNRPMEITARIISLLVQISEDYNSLHRSLSVSSGWITLTPRESMVRLFS
jgi:hypothetical protein